LAGSPRRSLCTRPGLKPTRTSAHKSCAKSARASRCGQTPSMLWISWASQMPFERTFYPSCTPVFEPRRGAVLSAAASNESTKRFAVSADNKRICVKICDKAEQSLARQSVNLSRTRAAVFSARWSFGSKEFHLQGDSSDRTRLFTRSSQEGLATPPSGICNLSAKILPPPLSKDASFSSRTTFWKYLRFLSNILHRGQAQPTENGSGFAPDRNRLGLLCCLSQFPRDNSPF
jgi:hypothetical protein